MDEPTLEDWGERHPAFSQAIDDGRTLAGGGADKSRELDKVHDTALACERRTAGQAGRYGLDPTACALWLKSHQPDPSASAAGTAPSGKDGDPTKSRYQEEKISDLELARRIAFIFARADHAIREAGTSNPSGIGGMATSSTASK